MLEVFQNIVLEFKKIIEENLENFPDFFFHNPQLHSSYISEKKWSVFPPIDFNYFLSLLLLMSVMSQMPYSKIVGFTLPNGYFMAMNSVPH